MFTKANAGLGLSLVFAVFLWGASNTGTKYIVARWPPIWTGGSRFTSAGLILFLLLRFTKILGQRRAVSSVIQRRLWWAGGLSLAAYVVAFNWALRFTSASHVALYLGCAPVWALLWEGLTVRDRNNFRRYAAAVLALAGLVVLFQPALKQGSGGTWIGELLGLSASLLWTVYGRECRRLAQHLSAVEISAHTMWRAGLFLLCLALVELYKEDLTWRPEVVWTQVYCILGGGVVTFWIWNNALQYLPASQVLLFNNLIPLSTMSWSWACLGEPVTSTFWFAMLLVFAGVLFGQIKSKPSQTN